MFKFFSITFPFQVTLHILLRNILNFIFNYKTTFKIYKKGLLKKCNIYIVFKAIRCQNWRQIKVDRCSYLTGSLSITSARTFWQFLSLLSCFNFGKCFGPPSDGRSIPKRTSKRALISLVCGYQTHTICWSHVSSFIYWHTPTVKGHILSFGFTLMFASWPSIISLDTQEWLLVDTCRMTMSFRNISCVIRVRQLSRRYGIIGLDLLVWRSDFTQDLAGRHWAS